MQTKLDDISKIIKEQIKNYRSKTEQDEIGYVISVGDGISKVHGIDKCQASELLEFSNGTYGMAQNLEENCVSAVLLGTDVGITEGSLVKRTGRVVSVPVGPAMIGRSSRPSRALSTRWKSTARWHIPSSLRRPRRSRHPCSISLPMPAAPWVNSSWTKERTC